MKEKKGTSALRQLIDEKKLMCKNYTDCRSCPCLLTGGFCEIQLAIKEMTRIVKISEKGGENDS